MSKMGHVLPFVTVFFCRYFGTFFIMVPIFIIATTLVYCHTFHGSFIEKWSFHWTFWIATLKNKIERAFGNEG